MLFTPRFLTVIGLTLLSFLDLAAAERPNVVFILSDNQSYYELSCHGHAQIKTPHIDAFAKESVEFTRFYAPPFCSPSRAVILTGRYAMRSGVHNTIGGRSILHRRETTIANILAKQGYRTGIFGKWHLGFSYPYRPQDRGFEEVFVHGGGGIGQMEDYFGNTHYGPTFLHNGEAIPSIGFSTDTLFDESIRWIKQNRDQPFFCYLPTPVTHSPHTGPKDLVQELKDAGVQGDLGLFAQVQNLDSNVGRMLKTLDELGLSKKTIVVFASDQGMNDRGAPHGGNRIGLGYDPAHHVPMFIRTPGGRSKVCGRIAGMIDMFATLLDLCGFEVPDNVDGISLKPLLSGDEADYPQDRTLIVQCPRGRDAKKWVHSAVKTERWRLVDGEKLYDIDADPRQKNDIASQHPELVEDLRAKYEAYWSDLPDQKSTLSRHVLGDENCPEVVLNGMDWYKGGQPWHSGHFKKSTNGKWAITIARDGKYEFDCHLYPREANLPAGATAARIDVGDLSREMSVSVDATHARFTLDLKAGDYDLQTTLKSEENEKGSLFVYAKRLP